MPLQLHVAPLSASTFARSSVLDQTRSPTNHTTRFIYRFTNLAGYTLTGLSSTLHFASLPMEHLNRSTLLPNYLMHIFNKWEPSASALCQLTGNHLDDTMSSTFNNLHLSVFVATPFSFFNPVALSVCNCSTLPSSSFNQSSYQLVCQSDKHVLPSLYRQLIMSALADPVHMSDHMHLRQLSVTLVDPV